jgi:hypothetical protein
VSLIGEREIGRCKINRGGGRRNEEGVDSGGDLNILTLFGDPIVDPHLFDVERRRIGDRTDRLDPFVRMTR